MRMFLVDVVTINLRFFLESAKVQKLICLDVGVVVVKYWQFWTTICTFISRPIKANVVKRC